MDASGEQSRVTATATPFAPTDGLIHFDTGVLRLDQLSALLDKLPLDITFVDETTSCVISHRLMNVFFPLPCAAPMVVTSGLWK